MRCCASTPEVVPNSPEAKAAIEERIRWRVGKPNAQSFPTYFKGELTKADLEKVTKLHLGRKGLTNVTGLKNLTQLKELYLNDNPALTKAQIDELKKALPKCKIYSNPKK